MDIPCIPNDLIEFVILGYNPVAFLSTCRRLNDSARSSITRLVDKKWDKYITQIIRYDPKSIIDTTSWTHSIFSLSNNVKPSMIHDTVTCIYMHDAVNCLRMLINTGYNVGLYSFERIFVDRSFKCLKEILKYNDGKFAMLAQVHAMRFDDAGMLAVILESGVIQPTSNKLYCALLERRINCYRYLLDRVIPKIETYEYLVSQDLHVLLDETLEHDASWDFKEYELNSPQFHKFAGDSSNIQTLRVLIKHGFNPLLHNRMAIAAAAKNNMSAAVALATYIDKISKK